MKNVYFTRVVKSGMVFIRLDFTKILCNSVARALKNDFFAGGPVKVITY